MAMGTSYDVNEHISGLYGFVYDENGNEIQGTQEFNADVEFDKEKIKQAGKFMQGNKITGASGKGSMNILKLDTVLQKKILENPMQKYNFMGKLADPTSRGEEAVLVKGVSFDGAPLMGFKLKDIVEIDLDFTFDDYSFVKTIG